MAEPIGALRVDLSANAAEFNKDMKSAANSVRRSTRSMNSSMKRFNDNVNKGIKGLTSFRAAAVVAAGGAGLFLLSKRAIETADNIGKTARAIGISAETLQELRFAAGRASIDVNTFDGALEAFSKRVGEARNNTGTLITILRQMSPTLLEQVRASQNVEEAFDLIIRASSGLENQLDRNALLAAAFGRTVGVQMVNFVKDGADGVDELRKKARELGVVLSNETIAKAEQAADELGDMEAVIKTAATAAGLELMPALRTIANTLTDPTFLEAVRSVSYTVSQMIVFFAKWHKEILGAVAGLITLSLALKTRVNPTVAAMASVFAGLAAVWAQYQAEGQSFTDTMDEITDATKRLTTAQSGGLTSALETSIETLARQNREMQVLMDLYKTAPDLVESYNQSIEREAAARSANIDTLSDEGREWSIAFRRGQEMKAQLEEIKEIHELMISPMDRYNERMERLNTLLSEGSITQEQYAKAVEGAKRELTESDQELKVQADLLRDAGRGAGDALKGFALQGRTASEVLDNFALSLAEAAAEALILAPLLEELDSIFANMSAPSVGGGGGGGLGGILSMFGGAAPSSPQPFGAPQQAAAGSSFLSFLPFFSSGGDHSGGLRVVGEHGPELEATGPSRIFNAEETKDIMSGSSRKPTYVIDARGSENPEATAAAVEVAIARIRPDIIREAADEVADRASRDVDYANNLRR